jgi:hypothetical protein
MQDPMVRQQRPRTGGYLPSIVVDVVLLYVAQHLLDWNPPWITSEWLDVVGVVNLSLTISIVGNALLLAYDAPWFRRLVDFVTKVVALVAGYWMYAIFPFSFAPEWDWLAHLALGAVLTALLIATVVTLVLAIAEFLRAGWRASRSPDLGPVPSSLVQSTRKPTVDLTQPAGLHEGRMLLDGGARFEVSTR